MNLLPYTMRATIGAMIIAAGIVVSVGGCGNMGSWTSRNTGQRGQRAPRATRPVPAPAARDISPIDDLNAAIYSTRATPLRIPGKIYVRGTYLFVSERGTGVHVIDNTDPSAPYNRAFIEVPGNTDIAVKGSVLYADSYNDLAAIDIADPMHARLLKRVRSVFPQIPATTAGQPGESEDDLAGRIRKGGSSDWMKKRTYGTYGTVGISGQPNGLAATASSGNSSEAGARPQMTSSNGGNGTGGSMARLTIVGDYLYAVTSSDMKIFSIRNPASPEYQVYESVGNGIETIFPYGDKLFIGSQQGMFIYENRDPQHPVRLGQFSHARACDPVVTDGAYAYVTLRGNGSCGGAANQLDVLDIRDLMHPTLLRTYPMSGPYGAAIDGRTLFVCDGQSGLKVYDALNPANLVLRQQITGIQAFDVIPYRNVAIVVGPDGLRQYDYGTLGQLRLLSTIPIAR